VARRPRQRPRADEPLATGKGGEGIAPSCSTRELRKDNGIEAFLVALTTKQLGAPHRQAIEGVGDGELPRATSPP